MNFKQETIKNKLIKHMKPPILIQSCEDAKCAVPTSLKGILFILLMGRQSNEKSVSKQLLNLRVGQ